MPRTNDSNFLKEKNKQTNKPTFLYTVFNYDGEGSDLCYTNYDETIIFDGTTYNKFPIIHDSVSENAQGRIDSVKIRLSNVSRLIQGYLESYDLRGKKVSIKQIWSDKTNDSNNYVEDVYYIDTFTTGQEDAEFICTSKFDVLKTTLPGRSYTRNYCPWKFKGTECGYSGSETSCNRTLARCRELNNSERFGGQPSTPQRRIIVG